ncbi:hypothetical protein B0I35DRAFT_476176 [Stachybotrys elegans]|uniref:Aminoglycoside phosphotransferase domain-containing protein n=1 Tax=Stachybotrys elegans TaxID=80388 RepID=A0A8K0WU99_9HYPO|nr:hypothetical protein B0I35DRAFT_476176 [Stachybotrys elegans]
MSSDEDYSMDLSDEESYHGQSDEYRGRDEMDVDEEGSDEIRMLVDCHAVAIEAARIRHEMTTQALPINAPSLSDTNSFNSSIAELPAVGDRFLDNDYNFFPITFHDGEQWIIKIPQAGTPEEWKDYHEIGLESEAKTLQMLQKRTTIPVPTVYSFDTSLNNPLKFPYMFLSVIKGLSLETVWYNSEDSPERRLQVRTRALEQIAAAMAQLDEFEYDYGGSPIIENNKIVGVGVVTVPFDGQHGYYPDGPFATGKGFYLSHLKQYPYGARGHPSIDVRGLTGKGERRLTRLFIDELCSLEPDLSFVLSHPYMDLSSFIVAPDGGLLGVVQWEGVMTCPKSMSNRAYPAWLVEDWGVFCHAWTEEQDERHNQEDEEDDCFDNPAELTKYRKIYRDAMAEIAPGSEIQTTITLATTALYRCTQSLEHRFDYLLRLTEESLQLVDPMVNKECIRADFVKALISYGIEPTEDVVLCMEQLRKAFRALLLNRDL